MYLSELFQIIGLDLPSEDSLINEIKTDSRLLNDGDIFLCLNQGYKYIEEALEKKVIAVITEKSSIKDKRIFLVNDTKKVLGIIGKYLRSKYQGKVIAITGSYGKTTTKEILSHLLSKKNNVLKSEGNHNNLIGVPLTLLKLNNSYDYVILEFGTNHLGEIRQLTEIAKPDIALITNIGSAHIGYFGSKENILKEKLDIKGPDTTLFVNGDDPLLENIDAIKAYAKDYALNDLLYASNYSIAFKVCESLGYSLSELRDYLNDLRMLPSRMEHHVIDDITIIDDAYNASYESFLYGIANIKNYKRKIIVFGDMLELGDYSEKLHLDVYDQIINLDNVLLLTIGQETSKLNNILHFNNLDSIIDYFKNFEFQKGDVIYLKGSHQLELSKLVTPLKRLVNDDTVL